jgi:hypothetical protein
MRFVDPTGLAEWVPTDGIAISITVSAAIGNYTPFGQGIPGFGPALGGIGGWGQRPRRRPTAGPPTTTSSDADSDSGASESDPVPNPENPESPESEPNHCEGTAKGLATIAANTSPWQMRSLGLGMMDAARQSAGWKLPWHDFKPELTASGQGVGVYRHVIGSAGAVVTADTVGVGVFLLRMGSDVLQLFSPPRHAEGRVEIAGNWAGARVGLSMLRASITGNEMGARIEIRRTLCK